MLAIGLLYMDFIVLSHFSSIPSLFITFMRKGC
jgi:hypothetical protein